MKSNVTRAIIGGIVGIGVITGGAWYMMSGTIVDNTRSLIERINAKPVGEGATVKITYGSLSRTAFPSVGVRIVDPVIEFSGPALADPETDAMAPVPAPIHGTWKHTGTVDIITDRLSHEYRLVNDGNGAGSLEAGEQKIALNSSQAHSEITLRAKNGDAFTQWQSLNLSDSNAVKQAVSQVGGVHLAAGPISITNTATNAVIMAQDEGKFDFTNRSDTARINFDLSAFIKGTRVTKEYVTITMQIMDMLGLPKSPFGNELPISEGKQDIEIAMNADLPTPGSQAMPSGTIHVTKFNITNDFYKLDAPLDIVLKDDADARHASIKLNWVVEITPAGAKIMEPMLDEMMAMAPGMMPAAGKDVNQALLKQKIIAALPTVSTLGPIHLTLDVDATTPKGAPQPTGSTMPGVKESVDLHNFSFGHKRWSLDAKGDATRDPSAAGATINGTLTCKQCSVFTQDVFDTIRAGQEVMSVLQPSVPPYPLTDTMLTQLNAVLGEIGKPGATAGDLDFVITTSADKNVLLNDKPIGDAMPKLMMVFSPPGGQPAATPEPAPAKQPANPAAPAI